LRRRAALTEASLSGVTTGADGVAVMDIPDHGFG